MKERIQQKLQELAADTERMYEEIEMLSEDQLNDDSYGWSILQVFSHLNDAEQLSLSYMQKKSQAGEKMGNATFGNGLRMWVTNQALKSSMKWKAPSYISKPPTYPLAELKTRWAKTRKAISDFVDQYPEQYLNKLVYKHPMGGRQNLEKAIESFIYHQRHHIHQIERIKKKIRA